MMLEYLNVSKGQNGLMRQGCKPPKWRNTSSGTKGQNGLMSQVQSRQIGGTGHVFQTVRLAEWNKAAKGQIGLMHQATNRQIGGMSQRDKGPKWPNVPQPKQLKSVPAQSILAVKGDGQGKGVGGTESPHSTQANST